MAKALDFKKVQRASYLRSQLSLVRNVQGSAFSSRLKPREAKALGEFLTAQVIEHLQAEDVTDDQTLASFGEALYGILPKQERGPGYHVLRVPVKTGTLRAMVWCEVMCYNHLTFSICGTYTDFQKAYRLLKAVVDRLEAPLKYLYHERYGYVSAQLTLMGTGLRVRSWMHLGGLGHFNLLRELSNAGELQGILVELPEPDGPPPPGSLVILFNRDSMGMTAEKILERYDAFLKEVIRQEGNALQRIYCDEPYLLIDRLLRVQAVFRKMLMIGETEAMDLLSSLRIGAAVGAYRASFNALAQDWFDLFRDTLFYPLAGKTLALECQFPPAVTRTTEWRDDALRAEALRPFADFKITRALWKRAVEQ